MKIARIAVPDFVSSSYFPAIAAIALDEFAKQELQVRHELIFPNYKAYEALRDGAIDFVAGPAHAALKAFPEWKGARLLCALAQGMYWLLVMRAELVEAPGDINIVKGRTIGAAPLVDVGLRQMIIDSGLDIERDRIPAGRRRRFRFCEFFLTNCGWRRALELGLPARSPNLNAYVERWVRSVKEECLSKVILFGERSLRRALSEYVEHFHTERNHQGKGNVATIDRPKNVADDTRRGYAGMG